MTSDTAIADPQVPINQPPSTAGMTTKVVKGSLWTLAGQVAPLGVSLVTTPFTIRLLGAEGYGVFILIGLIPTYLGFADFGMSMASTKFGSEAYAEGDEEKEGRIVRTAALIALCTSVPIAALLMLFAGQIISLFNVPPEYMADAVLALRLASITFVINFLCGIFNTPQLARLRMDLNTMVNAVPRILGLIATPIVIYLGFSVVGAIIVLLIASLATLTGHLIISRRLLPHLLGSMIDHTITRYLLRFGLPLAFSSVAAVLLVNSEKLILATVTSVKTLAYYTVAFTFANMATLFSGAMSQSLVPAFSRLLTPEKNDHLNSLYSRGLRLNVIGLLPLLFVSAIAARPFFTFWAGEDFGKESTMPFYVLLVGLFFHLSSYVSGSLIISSGRTDIIAKLFWAELVPFLVMTGILTSKFGAVGAASAWSLRVLIESFVLVWLAKKIGGVKIDFWGNPLNLLIGLLLLSPPLVLLALFEETTTWIFVLSPFCIAAYFALIWKTMIDQGEKQWIYKKIRVA